MPAVDTFGIVGTVIAEKYRVERVVDEGGFSVVYKAEHMIWREPVALKCFKVLSNAAADQRDLLLDAFIQEGKLMTSLSSRSAAIVQARDIGKLTTKDGQWIPYIVMEWLEGKPLDVVLWEENRHALPPRNLFETMALLEPAAIAFELCHQRGIAHRDIKPGNLIVIGDPRGPSPFVKVLDFGIAKVMAEHASSTTASAHTGKEITAFTPNYGAPEQFSRSHGATGPWTDVFAMALILVEVLRGGAPALEGNDFLQLGMASRDPQRRPSPRQFRVDIPDAANAVFERALAVDPEARFKTMGQFWAALHHSIMPDAATWTGGAGRQSMPGLAPPQGMPMRGQSAPYSPQSAPYSPQSAPYSPASGQMPGLAPSQQQMPHMQPMQQMPSAAQSGPYAAHPQTPQQMPNAAPSGPYGSPQSNPYSPASGQFPGQMQSPQQGANPYSPQSAQFGAPGYGPMPGAPTGAQPAILSPTPPAAPSSRKGLVAAVAVLAMVGGGVAAFRFLGAVNGPGSGAGTAAEPTASASATVAVSPSGSASAQPTSCPAGMVLVPGGKFFMGSDDAAFKLWQPAHNVTLDTFCIDVYEVTAEAYKACSDKGECKRPEPTPSYPKADSVSEADHEKNQKTLAEFCNFGKPGREKHPINCVTWGMADGYCKVSGGRLPTEAEWEFAARGSDGRKFPWGDDPGSEGHMNACGKECNAWEKAHGMKLTPVMYPVDDGYPGTAPVGSFPTGKTRFGSYDFVGNVWEWTADFFEVYKADEVVNPKGAKDGDRKAIRGGGFNGGVALWLNPAFRYHQIPTASAPALGFRCAKSL